MSLLQRIFSNNPIYKKRARLLAILWTLLIFIACFIPSSEVPDVRIPLIDKWVHFVLFGVFSFLWLCASTTRTRRYTLLVLVISCLFGWMVELLQGWLTFLGRSMDGMDVLADSIGGALGVVVFYILAGIMHRRANKHSSRDKNEGF